MFSFLKKQRWALVKTFEQYIMEKSNKENNCIVYFHLYESNKGNRKVDTGTKGLAGYSEKVVIDAAEGLELYQKRIYRWLNGRFDPEIPRYNEVNEEDVANALRGKVE